LGVKIIEVQALERGIEGEAADFLGDFFNHREIRQLLDIEGNVKRAAKDIGEGLARVIKFQTFGRIDLTNNG
jgi:hypothetical protein